MTSKQLEETLPTDEELIADGELDEELMEDALELDRREAKRQKDADGLEDANIEA